MQSLFQTPVLSIITNSPTVDLDSFHIMPKPPKPRCIDHPYFTRITPTHYLLKDPDNTLASTIHVGQIADYIEFDEHLRSEGLPGLQSMPHGYDEFAYLWNVGTQNEKRISRVYIPTDSQQYVVDTTITPVPIGDFFITSEQVGNSTPSTPASAPDNSDESRDTFLEDRQLAREYLLDAMEQRRQNRQGFAQRQEQRSKPYQQPEGSSGKPNKKGPPNKPYPLSRLRFKRKRRMQSPSPDKRPPTPKTTEAHGGEPAKPAPPSVEHTAEERSNELVGGEVPMETTQ